MTRLLRILAISWLALALSGCDYLPSWVPGAGPDKTATQTQAKPRQKSKPAEELPVEEQILKLQQEIQAVEEERRKLEQRRDEIRSEKETLTELLQEQEADIRRKERELNRRESGVATGG
jgi:chromosome segregation ATPase